MMVEVMTDTTKEKVVLDETCENTKVVNELYIPILCMGCKDLIVAQVMMEFLSLIKNVVII